MAGNLEFITSASGSSVSSLSVTDCFSADYDVYEIYVTSYEQSAVADSRFSLLDSGGSEITSANYDSCYLALSSSSAFTEGRQTAQTHFRDFSFSVTNYAYTIGVKIVMYNPYDSSSYTFTKGQSSVMVDGYGVSSFKAISVHKSAEQITGFQIYTNAVSFNATVKVYGVK